MTSFFISLKKGLYFLGIVSVLLLNCSLLANAQRSTADSSKRMSYIENKSIRVGIDLNLGGSITYIADIKKGENIINNNDWGRQVQMSFYSGPNPFTPNGKEPAPFWRGLGWNPIQSGDYSGKRSKVVESRNDGDALYVKCIPMQWPLNDEPGECTFESWITLKGNTVHVRSRLVNNREDKTQYHARSQELPAVYTNAPYHRLITYRGSKPFTHDTVSNIANHNFPRAKSINWAYWQATEGWAANVNDNDYGLGVWNPNAQSFCGGFYGDGSFKGGSKDSPTAYISPLNSEILDHNISYEYTYVLILGKLDEIRDYIYHHAGKRKLPEYSFKTDRQHWTLENTTDSGWPITDGLNIKLTGKAAMVSPQFLWNATEVSEINFSAQYSTPVKRGKVFLRRFGQPDFDQSLAYDFEIISDGKSRQYQIPLKNSAGYSGAFSGIKILLTTDNTTDSGVVKVTSVSLKK